MVENSFPKLDYSGIIFKEDNTMLMRMLIKFIDISPNNDAYKIIYIKKKHIAIVSYYDKISFILFTFSLFSIEYSSKCSNALKNVNF